MKKLKEFKKKTKIKDDEFDSFLEDLAKRFPFYSGMMSGFLGRDVDNTAEDVYDSTWRPVPDELPEHKE